jgi:hypothetical protein
MPYVLTALGMAQIVVGALVIFTDTTHLQKTLGAIAFGMGTLTLGTASAIAHLSAIRGDQRRMADAVVSIWHRRQPKEDLAYPDKP